MDTFDTPISIAHLELLMDIGSRFGFHPLSSLEAESYFVKLLESAPSDALEEYLISSVEKAFKTMATAPQWIQDPEWQFTSNGPMLFIGQLHVSGSSGYFHDDGYCYIFFDPKTGVFKTVLQLY